MTKNMTVGSPIKLVLLFSVPIMLGNLLQQLYNTVDSIFVGNYVGETALGAVGTCGPMTVLFVALAIGLSVGSGIVIAQYFGAGQIEEMRKTASTVIILIVSVGVVLSVVGVFVAEWLLRVVLNAPESVIPYAKLYFQIYSIGLVFQFGYNIVAALLRSVGDSKASLYFLVISSLLNVVLDYIFIAVFEWGVAGAAIATVVSQFVSVTVSVIYMLKKYPIFRFKRSEFVFSGEKCALTLKIAIPTTIQQCIISSSQMAVQRVINGFGEAVLAGCTAAIRLENYLSIPCQGFSAGIATYTAQNIGAGKVDRVKQGYRGTLLMGIAVSAALAVIAVTFATRLVGLFNVTEGFDVGVQYIRSIAPFFVIFCMYQTTAGVLQGAGDTVTTMCLTLASLIVRVAGTYLLAGWLGYRAIWYAAVSGWIIILIPTVIRYLQGKWKTRAIVEKSEMSEAAE